MGSTGEPDRKRRLSSSVSPAVGAPTAKRPPLAPCSEDKKLDFAVLKYKNQKLSEQVEAHRVEYHALESKFNLVKEKQKAHSGTLVLVNNSWERLVGDLERISVCSSGSPNRCSSPRCDHAPKEGVSTDMERDFLSRLMEAGATESSQSVSTCQLENNVCATQTSAMSVLGNILSSSNNVWHVKKELALALLASLPENESSRHLQDTSNELLAELSNVIQVVEDIHLKHRQLTEKYQNHRDSNARTKAEQRRLKEELASTVAELEESNHKLAALKRNNTPGTPILFPTLGNKNIAGEKVRDKQKELKDLEATHKELTDLISKRLADSKRLHEERIEIFKKLASFQNILTDFKSISTSKAFLLLNDQLKRSQTEMDQYRILLEKLQVDKDNFIWHEREVNVKVDLAEIPRWVSAYSDSRLAELEQDMQKLADEKNLLEVKLEEALREPGRKQVISEFKVLVSSLPKDMGVMQSELSKYKDTASELHSLRAEVQSLTSILSRKESETEALSDRSAHAGLEIRRLQTMARDLRQTNQELKLFVEMYKRESTDSRDVMESRDREYNEWALVQSLKSSLDERKLEQRVKAANEAEAISQQRLAMAEAEIAELRQKLETSRRDIDRLSEILKSKHEEGEAYLSEIESIGQAYEDIQTQNQHLLQQIIERDDHNTKLCMEGVKAKQVQDALHLEVCTLHRNLHHANTLMDLYSQKIVRLEDQLKAWSDQIGKLAEDGWQNSVSLGNAQRKLVDVQGEAQQLRQSMDGTQAKVGKSRLEVAELLVELEKERFSKKRIEDELEVMSRKAASLRVRTEGLTILEKLRQEVREYRGILKCGICHDRQKEVVIAKCYHLFCNQCIQKSLGSRQRRCPSCSSSFGPNDVKPIYI